EFLEPANIFLRKVRAVGSDPEQFFRLPLPGHFNDLNSIWMYEGLHVRSIRREQTFPIFGNVVLQPGPGLRNGHQRLFAWIGDALFETESTGAIAYARYWRERVHRSIRLVSLPTRQISQTKAVNFYWLTILFEFDETQ